MALPISFPFGPGFSLLDLTSMTERVHSGYYSCLRLFLADFRRIILNCRSYNERGTEYYKCAANLEKFFMTKMKSMGLWYDLNA